MLVCMVFMPKDWNRNAVDLTVLHVLMWCMPRILVSQHVLRDGCNDLVKTCFDFQG